MTYCLRSNNKHLLRYFATHVFLVAVILLWIGCDTQLLRSSDDRVLAKVHGKYLYASEVAPLLSTGLSPQDSIAAVENYVNSWVRQQLLLYEAEANLSQVQKDFSKQLENYRNSLIIYEFESKMIKENMDTLVTKDEIEAYYNVNKQDFELKENILKANYLQIDIESSDLKKLRNHWRSGKPSDKTAMMQYCRRNGLNYSFDNDEWLFFNDFMQEIPIRTYNQEDFLKYNRNIEVRDSLYIYLVEIRDFKVKESTAPLSMQENIIRNIIINRRKQELIQKMQEDIFIKGLEKNQFEIYQ